MERYNPTKIEEKWQKKWETEQSFQATKNAKDKVFLAEMFPYPSGAGLHVGHVRNFSIVDVLTRFYAQNGKNVLRPFGYDTFGLPAENYAIKTGISPAEATKTNINNFRKQAKRLGFYIDWSREINTSDPEYYRWTQWCFLQLYKKGLAYQKESYQWWCPVDQTVLANEQVENGHCWRCGTEVEKKKMKQWFFKITAYADELLSEIDSLDWPEKIKIMQKNWIGRSEGANVKFQVQDKDLEINIFTTRIDTIFGATFLVLAPEHPLITEITTSESQQTVNDYCKTVIKKSEIERQENKEKTGVFTGSYAINPATNQRIPIWISDYILINYGDGAVMAVPAHDERDFAFAKKYNLEIKSVISPNKEDVDIEASCYSGEGSLIDSGDFSGLSTNDARTQILDSLSKKQLAKKRITYRMRDWLISRQRYWGCPIPIAYDKAGNPHAIPEDKLPVLLPEVADYRPDQSGRSALAKAENWLKVEIDGEEMTRETDTLDGYACSSWYLWRYASPHDYTAAWNQTDINYWDPLDIYCGADHAVAHLLYIRFWCKFFADQKLLPFREPIKKLLYNGYINAPDGKKMSKSKGNIIDPLDVIDSGYGADTLRTYELFIGPYDEDAAWSTTAIGGVYRFLNRCFNLCFNQAQIFDKQDQLPNDTTNLQIRHKTIKKVTLDIKNANFNTAVAALMEYVNALYKKGVDKTDLVILAKLLKPFAPHLASEILEFLDADDAWPTYDNTALVTETACLVIQVNGKVRAKLNIAVADLQDSEKIKTLALSCENVQKYLDKEPRKIIIPKGTKLVNIVT